MTTTKNKWISFPPDWLWVAVGYCFFVIGHLFPLSIFHWLSVTGTWMGSIAAAWAFGGLAVISFMIGFRSRGVRIVEAVIAALVYTVTMNIAFSNFWTGTLQINGAKWLILAFITSAISASIGEVMQLVKTKKA
jgi:hypothetical protein